MAGPGDIPLLREARLAGRLERLFRIERRGGFARLPAATIHRLSERRAALVETLAELENARRSAGPTRSPILDPALSALAREVERSLPAATVRVETLRAELDLQRGAASGLRDGGASRLLGRG